MTISKFVIEGFANIERIELNVSKISALVALNNYGKTNVLAAIDFGIDFINNPHSTKKSMMAFKPYIPINKNIDENPFSFELTLIGNWNHEEHTIVYGYSFDWIKNEKSKGQRIKGEYFRVKSNKSDSKFKTYLSRDLNKALYLSSPTGRCDKPLKISKSELSINKLESFDDLFYIDLINTLNAIRIATVNTLQNPNKLFRTISSKIVTNDYSLEMPDDNNVAFFIYSLKSKKPNLYDLLKDSIISLLPSVEDFEPVEIDFKKELQSQNSKLKLPLDFPEKVYDIAIKEKNNNQQTQIDSVSSGSQKIFYIIAMAVAAEINNIPLVTFEELENSIHPGLLQKLLIILNGLTEKTKILITSHSPYLIQYLEVDKIKIGLPNDKNLAIFKELKKTKIKTVVNIAEDMGTSIGDVIFDKMLESATGESDFINDLCL